MAASTSFTVLTPFRQANPCSLGPWAPCPCYNLVRGTWRAACIASANFVTVGPLAFLPWWARCAPSCLSLSASLCLCLCLCLSDPSVLMSCALRTRSRASQPARYVLDRPVPSQCRTAHSTVSHAGQVPSMLFELGLELGLGLGAGAPTYCVCVQRGWMSVDGLTIDD